ncbi:hypothetical protein [Duganella rivi]|nr:hypothetical protein [Duganella rivi]
MVIDQFEMRIAAAVEDLTTEVRRWIIVFGVAQAALLIMGIVIA